MPIHFREPGIILLDASSIRLVYEDSTEAKDLFWGNLLNLPTDNIKVLVPIGVIRELFKAQENHKNSEAVQQACSDALADIKQYKNQDSIVVYNDHMNADVDDKDVHADKSFINFVNAYKMKYNIYVITQDVDLMEGIYETAGLECLSGQTKDEDGDKHQSFRVKQVVVLKILRRKAEDGALTVLADQLVSFRPKQTMFEYASANGLSLEQCLEIANKVSDTPVIESTLARPFLQRAIATELGLNGDTKSAPKNRKADSKKPETVDLRQASRQQARSSNIPPFVKFTGPFDKNKCVGVSASGQETDITLGNQIGSGGEGFVFSTNLKNTVAKVFQPGNATPNKYNKIAALLTKGCECEGICFPTRILLNERSEFIGYLMPQAEGEAISNLLNAQVIKREYPSLTRVDLVRLAISILRQIEYLHSNDILMCDINNENILFSNIGKPSLKTFLIDTDSYQIEDLLGEVGVPEYTPPELIGKRLDQVKRTKQNEYFIVATLLFSIMLPGQKPYAHIGGTANTAEDIRAGIFPYAHGKEYTGQGAPSKIFRRIWSHLAYKTYFWNTFHREGDHRAEGKRYDVTFWLNALDKYEKMLVDGTIESEDPEGLKVFPTDFKMPKGSTKTCPYCNRNRIPVFYEYCDECKDKAVETRICAECKESFDISRGMKAWEVKNNARNTICLSCKSGAKRCQAGPAAKPKITHGSPSSTSVSPADKSGKQEHGMLGFLKRLFK